MNGVVGHGYDYMLLKTIAQDGQKVLNFYRLYCVLYRPSPSHAPPLSTPKEKEQQAINYELQSKEEQRKNWRDVKRNKMYNSVAVSIKIVSKIIENKKETNCIGLASRKWTIQGDKETERERIVCTNYFLESEKNQRRKLWHLQ